VNTLNEFFKKHKSIYRWALVGVITNLFDYLIFLFLYSITPSVLFANFFSGLVSFTFNYLSHYFWSFESTSNHKQSGKRFLVNLVVIWSFGTLLLVALISSGIDPSIAKLIPIIITAPVSYYSMNIYVFKNTPKKL
jgi:putative flippase GtrA